MVRNTLIVVSLLLLSSLAQGRVTSLITLPRGEEGSIQYKEGGVFQGTSTIKVEPSSSTIYTGAIQFEDGTVINSADGLGSAGGASALGVNDDGVSITTPTSQINFVGAGVTVTLGGSSTATVTIPGGGASALDDLTDVDDSSRQTNYALLFNGTEWVAAAQGTSFTFEINTFTDNQSSTIEMGTANGPWLTAGNMTFSATYNNGPPIGSTVTHSGWSALPMTSSFQGPTANVDIASYPAAVGSKTWTLSAETADTQDTAVITINFYNYRFWGTTIAASSYTEAIVEGIGNSELSNSKAKSFTVNAGTNEYIVWASPTRLGTVTFTVGGFEGGFGSPETVSITTSAGFTENFYVYRSVNHSLGSTTVTTE